MPTLTELALDRAESQIGTGEAPPGSNRGRPGTGVPGLDNARGHRLAVVRGVRLLGVAGGRL